MNCQWLFICVRDEPKPQSFCCSWTFWMNVNNIRWTFSSCSVKKTSADLQTTWVRTGQLWGPVWLLYRKSPNRHKCCGLTGVTAVAVTPVRPLVMWWEGWSCSSQWSSCFVVTASPQQQLHRWLASNLSPQINDSVCQDTLSAWTILRFSHLFFFLLICFWRIRCDSNSVTLQKSFVLFLKLTSELPSV